MIVWIYDGMNDSMSVMRLMDNGRNYITIFVMRNMDSKRNFKKDRMMIGII